MKKILSVILLVSFVLPLVGCDTPQTEQPVDYEALNAGIAFETSEEGYVVLPAPLSIDGVAFRGWFTGPEGTGDRIYPNTLAEGLDVIYPYYTPTEELTHMMYSCYTPFAYDADATEENFREMKEFGLTAIILDYEEGNTPGKSHENFLDCVRWCEQYDIDFMIFHGTIISSTIGKEEMLAAMKDYIESPNFKCIFVRDEPGFDDLYELHCIVDNIRANLADVRPDVDCHIDLCNLGLMGPMSRLKVYYDYYVRYFNTDTICTDLYAFGGDTDDILYDYYFYGFDAVAKAALAGDYTLWTYIATMSHCDPYLDMKYGMYGNLLFGGRGQLFFHYGYPQARLDNISVLDSSTTMFDRIGGRNGAWYGAQRVIDEIDYFEDVYIRYEWRRGGSVFDDPENEHLTRAVKEAYKYKYNNMVDIQTPDGLIVTEYDEINGDGMAFMIFNACAIPDHIEQTVRFKLPYAQSVTMYMDMTTTVLTPGADGYYEITIPGTSGAFLTVEIY